MTRHSFQLGAALALVAALPAAAHPGHGGASAGWLHFLATPEHALPLALLALASAAAVARHRRDDVALLARTEGRGRHRRA